MGTLQSGNTPGARIAAGDSVIEAAKAVDTAAVAKRLTVFTKVHKSYASADALVKKASLALHAQQAKVGEADVTQDDEVLGLAAAMAGDGMPRLNPFRPLGFVAPAALCALGYSEEAKEVLRLENAVLKKKTLSKGTIAAAKAMGKAALAVQAAQAKVPALEKARTAAMTQRDALAQAWETAFAGLKRAARAAGDEGAPGLYTALFERKAAPKKAKGKKGDAEAGGGGKPA